MAHSVTFEQHDVVLSSSAEIGNILQASVVVMMSELFFSGVPYTSVRVTLRRS